MIKIPPCLYDFGDVKTTDVDVAKAFAKMVKRAAEIEGSRDEEDGDPACWLNEDWAKKPDFL